MMSDNVQVVGMASGGSKLLWQPAEVIHMIIEHLDEKDINSLIRTCRTLHNQFNGHLYRRNVKYGKNTALEWGIHHTNPHTTSHALAAGARVDRPLRDCQEGRSLSSPLWDTPLVVAVHLWPESSTNPSEECLQDHMLIFNALADHGAVHWGVAGGLMMYEAAQKNCRTLAGLLFDREDSKGLQMHRLPETLHEAIAHVDETSMVGLLIFRGWDVNGKDTEGRTPYGCAVDSENWWAANLLEMSGAEKVDYSETLY